MKVAGREVEVTVPLVLTVPVVARLVEGRGVVATEPDGEPEADPEAEPEAVEALEVVTVTVTVPLVLGKTVGTVGRLTLGVERRREEEALRAEERAEERAEAAEETADIFFCFG